LIRLRAIPERLQQSLIALVAGMALGAAFAPLAWWPLAMLSPAVLMQLWSRSTPRRAAWLGFCYSFGTFSVGTYWLYVSIHVFGQAPVWMALALMLGLVCIMALYYAALGHVIARWLPTHGVAGFLVAMPAAWLRRTARSRISTAPDAPPLRARAHRRPT